MHSQRVRIGIFVALLLSASLALADQKIKTKSNIKNDRLAEQPASGSDCPEAVATEETRKTETTPAVDCKPASASKSSAAATQDTNK